ncbi:hypothetical protein ASB7_09090 [Helicobacter ailurogastricus]|nr:hypothetical protein ASB7_09090 [Helicobacter ailurogastricus]
MSHIFYGILIWICVEIALVLCIVVVLVAFEFCKGIIKGIADMIAKLKAPKNAAQPPQATPPTESKTTSETKLIENKATIPKSDVSGQEIHAYKGVFMNLSKAPMGFYDLKAYLIIHKAGCLSWIAEHALKNFGWVCLNEIHQAQGAHIAWGDITDDQIYRGKEVHYFFAGICTERQRAQNPISFKDKTEVISFLVQVFKPYVLQDPNHVYHLSEAHDNLQSVDIPMERFSRRLYLEIVKIWETEFAATLEEILLETDDLPREAHMLIKDLPFLPKEVALALEQYRDGNIYAFSTMHQTPEDLPPFSRQIMCNALTRALKSGQGGLAGVVDRLVRPEREPVLKRKARKQLAKICLKKFYGVLTPKCFADFKLDRPKPGSFLGKCCFICRGQEHYYIEHALKMWALQRLLEIFSGSIETRGVEEELLSRLSPEQARDFTKAFGEKVKDLQNPMLWLLISHLHLPLSVFKEQDQLIIAPNPNFKPNVFLDKKPHDREMVRLLYSFNTLSPQEKQEKLANLRHLIPDYALHYKLPPSPKI